MQRLRGAVWACGLILFGVGVNPLRADGDGLFQPCCNRCQPPAVSCYPAPVRTNCYVQRSYYEPATRYHCREYGPVRTFVRRVFGLPTTCCKPCCPPAPVCAPPCPPAISASVTLGAPPVPLPGPPAQLAPPPPVPIPAAPPVGAAPGNGYERAYPPPPQTPAPPISGSAYRPQQRVGSIPMRPLTPPLPPPPVRLDRIASTEKQANVPMQVVGFSPER